MDNTAEISIRKASFVSLYPHACIQIVGKRQSRKTTWATYLHNELERDFGGVDVFCGNRVCRYHWRKIVEDPSRVHLDNKEAVLTQILREQDDAINKYREQTNQPMLGVSLNTLVLPPNLKRLIIVDECEHDPFMKSRVFQDLQWYMFRHCHGTFVITTSQRILPTPEPEYVGITSNTRTSTRDAICDRLGNFVSPTTTDLLVKTLVSNERMAWVDTKGGTLQTTLFHAKIPHWPLYMNRFQVRRALKRMRRSCLVDEIVDIRC